MPFLPAKKSRAYEGPECPWCTAVLAVAQTNGPTRCPACKSVFTATWFAPVAVAANVPLAVGSAGPDGGAPCAWHAGNLAEVSCSRCGSFICGLCRIDIEKRTLCTNCFDRQSKEGALASTILTTRDWAARARSMAFLGLVFIWIIGPVLGAAAIYYSIRGRKEKKAASETDGLTSLGWMLAVGIIDVVGGLALWFSFAMAATQ